MHGVELPQCSASSLSKWNNVVLGQSVSVVHKISESFYSSDKCCWPRVIFIFTRSACQSQEWNHPEIDDLVLSTIPSLTRISKKSLTRLSNLIISAKLLAPPHKTWPPCVCIKIHCTMWIKICIRSNFSLIHLPRLLHTTNNFVMWRKISCHVRQFCSTRLSTNFMWRKIAPQEHFCSMDNVCHVSEG